MPTAASNGMRLEYETFGDASSPAVLLISGLGSQMIAWPEEFCELLANAGAYVVRFDNRDTGMSTWLDDLRVPELPAVRAGEVAPPYTLNDMATDAACLLGELAIPAAHVVGSSLGGYIAQLVAIEHPGKVLSLTSIMSSPSGNDAVPGSFTVEPPTDLSDPNAFIEQRIAGLRELSGPHFDEDSARALMGRMLERGVTISGRIRQAAAGAAAAPRLAALAKLRLPVLVVHGDLDTRIPLENGIRTAGAVPGSRLLVVPEMGHELPRIAWPLIARAIMAQVRERRVGGETHRPDDPSPASRQTSVQTVVAAPAASVRALATDLAHNQGWSAQCDDWDWRGPATSVTVTMQRESSADGLPDDQGTLQRRISTVREVVQALGRLKEVVEPRRPA